MLPVNVRSVKDLIISAKATMMEDAVICVGLQRSTALKITLSSSVIYLWLYFCFNSSAEKNHNNNKKNVNTVFSIQLNNSVLKFVIYVQRNNS